MGDSPPKTIRVVAAIVEREGRYLITQRRPNAVLPMLWDFPGGRVEVGEADAEALQREMKERLGVGVKVHEPWLCYNSHPYEAYTVEQYVYQCELVGGEPQCLAVQDYRWVASDDFESYPFTPVDEASMNQLLGES